MLRKQHVVGSRLCYNYPEYYARNREQAFTGHRLRPLLLPPGVVLPVRVGTMGHCLFYVHVQLDTLRVS